MSRDRLLVWILFVWNAFLFVFSIHALTAFDDTPLRPFGNLFRVPWLVSLIILMLVLRRSESRALQVAAVCVTLLAAPGFIFFGPIMLLSLLSRIS